MNCFVGLTDVEGKGHQEPKKRDKSVIVCKRTHTEIYEQVVQRLYVDIEVADCNSSEWYRMKAVWDTGATMSMMSRRKAEEMKLAVVDGGVCVGSTGQEEMRVHYVKARLSEGLQFDAVRVGSVELNNHDIDFIIGMDIISKGDFSVCNKNGRTKVIFAV